MTERQFRPDDVIQRWWRSRVVVLVTKHATGIVAELRHPDASPEHPVVVRLYPSGGPDVEVTLTAPMWHTVQASLAPTIHTTIRQMHRLDMYGESPGNRALEMRPLRVLY